MPNYLKEMGPKLIENGYLPIPIPPGTKGPTAEGWPSMRLTAEQCDKFPGQGVGLLCGIGDNPLMGIDVDSTNEDIVNAMLGMVREVAPCNLERVGRAPRVMLVVRASEEGFKKMSSDKFEDADGEKHQLEILGKGQQFVAYHIHPDTHKPYEWTGFVGVPTDTKAQNLSEVSEEAAEKLCRAFEKMCLDLGMTVVEKGKSKARKQAVDSDSLDDIKLPDPKQTSAKVSEHLGYLDPDVSYDQWRDICFALHLQFQGSEEGYKLFDDWSSGGSKYTGPEDTRKLWDSCDDNRPGNKISIGTVIKWAKDARKEAEKAIRKACLDELMAKIPECKDTSDLIELASDSGIQDKADRLIFIQAVQARFKELSGGTSISKADLVKIMKPKYEGHFELTELGNARRMVAEYGHGMMYVPQTNTWYKWAGSHWELVSDTQIEALAISTIEKMSKEAKEIEGEEERAAVQSFAMSSQCSRMFENMRKNAGRLPEIMHHVDELDANKNLFACGNGVIDLREGKLLLAAPSQRITRATKVDYDAGADCPLWKQTINDVFEGKEQLIKAFQCAVGYSMLGNPTAQVLFIPFGNGANGKSTVFSILRQIFGKHGVTSAADTFVGKGTSNAGGPREDLLRLKDARFIYVSELDEGEELKEGFVKSLTGGEATIARGQHGRHSVEFTPTGAVWMPTNHLPTVKGVDEAIWRRLFPIPFEHTFTADQRDPDRTHKLRQELSGILNWCLEGVRLFHNNGRLMTSPEIEEARAHYKSDMDILGDWMSECCERKRGVFTPSVDLFASWRSYAERNGIFGMTANIKKFGRQLSSRGFRPDRQRIDGRQAKGFWGLAIKAFDDLTNE